MIPFGARLAAALDERLPVCVGIDPHPGLLADWGLSDDARGLEAFALRCVEALAGRVAALKPQSAFFERHASAGIAVLERTVAAARAAGTLVVLDAKRGDIGSTMAAYADAYLHPGSPLFADALTVSPYLGVGALDPAFAAARSAGCGLFVLARTSNPEAGPVQRARAGDRSVAQLICDEVGAHNREASPLGSFGLVVGATLDELELDLAGLNGPLLVPGVGAQGGTVDDVRRLFEGCTAGVLASVSREVLRAGPDGPALAHAAESLAVELRTLRPG